MSCHATPNRCARPPSPRHPRRPRRRWRCPGCTPHRTSRSRRRCNPRRPRTRSRDVDIPPTPTHPTHTTISTRRRLLRSFHRHGTLVQLEGRRERRAARRDSAARVPHHARHGGDPMLNQARRARTRTRPPPSSRGRPPGHTDPRTPRRAACAARSPRRRARDAPRACRRARPRRGTRRRR